jgi:hypothetical protein
LRSRLSQYKNWEGDRIVWEAMKMVGTAGNICQTFAVDAFVASSNDTPQLAAIDEVMHFASVFSGHASNLFLARGTKFDAYVPQNTSWVGSGLPRSKHRLKPFVQAEVDQLVEHVHELANRIYRRKTDGVASLLEMTDAMAKVARTLAWECFRLVDDKDRQIAAVDEVCRMADKFIELTSLVVAQRKQPDGKPYEPQYTRHVGTSLRGGKKRD